MTKRVVSKPSLFFSLKLRDGTFSLMQFISRNGHVAVFDAFRDVDQWDDLEIREGHLMFVAQTTKPFLRFSQINTQVKVRNPKSPFEVPTKYIDPGKGFRRVTVYAGTDHERELLIVGDGHAYCLNHRFDKDGHLDLERVLIPSEYIDDYRSLELSRLRDYPEFNERVFLCKELGQNVDPLKDISLYGIVREEYRVYIEIISGKVALSSLGY